MRQFFKFAFASCLGVFLAGILMFFLMIIIGTGFLATGSQKSTVQDNSILKIDFPDPVPERTNNVEMTRLSFDDATILGLQDIVSIIEKAAEDDRILGIQIEPMSSTMGVAQSRVFLEAIREFRNSGKIVTAYADYYTQPAYYISSAADQICVSPIGTVDFRGIASYVPFFKEFLDKIGVHFNIYYAGDFKSATEPFRRKEMSPQNRLQIKEFLEDVYGTYLSDVAAARGHGLTAQKLKELAYQFKVRDADDALANGLVDMVGFKSDLRKWSEGQLGLESSSELKEITLKSYAQAISYRNSGSGSDRIAVVYAEGEIRDGKEAYGQIRDGQYVPLLEKIRKNEKVKAVVFRINSPGGSMLAGEKIYRQIMALKDKGVKVVVSMSDLAASGGYYISAPADSIFAAPNTLTGSIGVYTMVPNVHELLEDKVGIRFDTVQTGPISAGFTPYLKWSENEHKYIQRRVDKNYELFLQGVADGRGMSVEDVRKVAQGRVWTGKKALELGLVDRIGDLKDAIASAASLANLETYRVVEYPKFKNPLQKIIEEILNPGETQAKAIRSQIREIVPETLYLELMEQAGEPQARLLLDVEF